MAELVAQNVWTISELYGFSGCVGFGFASDTSLTAPFFALAHVKKCPVGLRSDVQPCVCQVSWCAPTLEHVVAFCEAGDFNVDLGTHDDGEGFPWHVRTFMVASTKRRFGHMCEHNFVDECYGRIWVVCRFNMHDL